MPTTRHTVDDVPWYISNLIINKFRVVAHTMGPVAEGAAFSQNHWSIYLIYGTGSVRLNMELADSNSTDRRGIFTVTGYEYTGVSISAVRYCEFPARRSNLAVYWIFKLIKDKGRHKYDMAEIGVGYRH
ncbi:hypothetical protein MMC17_004329 [Xylographa soralifera]|nr:hypothetical protein [Xylographa soralifera]